MKPSERAIVYELARIVLTMLERSPEEGEVQEVVSDLKALMARLEPSKPPRARPAQPKLGGEDAAF